MMNESKYGVLRLAIRVCVHYFKTAKTWGALEQGAVILYSVSWTLGVIAMQMLFDIITNAGFDELSFRLVALPLVFLSGITIMQEMLHGASNFLFDKVSYTNMGKFMKEFQLKLGRISAEHFENTQFLDNVNKAKECVKYESLGMFAYVCLRTFSYYLIFFISIGTYLFWLSPTLPLVILVAFVPAILGQFAQVKIFSKLEDENAPLRRRCEYYHKAIAGREFFKETRILGGFRYFYKLFSDTLMLITEKTWKANLKAFILRLILNLISFVGLGASILLLFNATMAGNISVGAFAAVFAVLARIFSIMDDVVSRHLSRGSQSLGQVANFYRIMDMEEQNGEDGLIDFSRGVTAENVCFSYPGRNESTLQRVNLKINKGETIAIVGENGSGKTTLVRLLIGLYTPSDGKVEIGGLDSRKTKPSAIFQDISAVFQHFQRYKITLAENVSISNTIKPPDINNISKSLKESEFNDDKISLDTMLSPEFDGIDLSGGQWQRLAIARGLYRTNNFIVLDEPTAAIDPIEEGLIYNKFKDLSQGKCAIVVTHRLGSVKFSDRIVVMDNGTIADIGTHDELIKRKGVYANMWATQAAWYDKG